MKKLLFIACCPVMSVFGQSVTMVSQLNHPVSLYVDGVRTSGTYSSVSVGSHNLEARYAQGSLAAQTTVYFPREYSYTWYVRPPDVQLVIKRQTRVTEGTHCTEGELYVNGNTGPFCKTLELPFENNYNNFSSIAVGTYAAFVGHTNQHPNGVIQLKDVRSIIYYDDNGTWRSGRVNRNAGGPVEIHSGNWPRQSKGCILVGQEYAECHIADSYDTLQRLYVEYFDPDGDGRPNSNVKVTVRIQLDYE